MHPAEHSPLQPERTHRIRAAAGAHALRHLRPLSGEEEGQVPHQTQGMPTAQTHTN